MSTVLPYIACTMRAQTKSTHSSSSSGHKIQCGSAARLTLRRMASTQLSRLAIQGLGMRHHDHPLPWSCTHRDVAFRNHVGRYPAAWLLRMLPREVTATQGVHADKRKQTSLVYPTNRRRKQSMLLWYYGAMVLLASVPRCSNSISLERKGSCRPDLPALPRTQIQVARAHLTWYTKVKM